MKERKDSGVAIVRWKYDENGNTIEGRYFGTDEQLKERKDLGIAIVRAKYDEKGNITKTIFLNRKEEVVYEIERR